MGQPMLRIQSQVWRNRSGKGVFSPAPRAGFNPHPGSSAGQRTAPAEGHTVRHLPAEGDLLPRPAASAQLPKPSLSGEKHKQELAGLLPCRRRDPSNQSRARSSPRSDPRRCCCCSRPPSHTHTNLPRSRYSCCSPHPPCLLPDSLPALTLPPVGFPPRLARF